MALLEDEVIAWARRLGYANNDATLSKQSITKLLRTPGCRPLFEFFVKVPLIYLSQLLAHVRPPVSKWRLFPPRGCIHTDRTSTALRTSLR